MRTETFVDTSRATVDPGGGADPASAKAERPTRTLRTQIYYPAGGGEGAGPQTDAPVAAGGPFPLLIFAHGHTVSDPGAAYDGLLQSWAAAGYVVAAPTFPLSSTRLPGGLADLASQPADVSFVLSQLLGLSATPGGPYAGVIDPDRVGMAGHSLGGMTTVGVTANTCCVDGRFKAAVVLAGAERSFRREGFFPATPHIPTMVVHGDADRTVSFADGRKVFNDAHPPKVMLTLVGGDHLSPYTGDSSSSFARLVTAATVDFFDRYVKGDTGGLERLRSLAAGNPDARLEVDAP
jgi:dienelactone hydrolase